MADRVTPPVQRKPALSSRVLDTVIGIGALLILIPALPIIVLVWLIDRLLNSGDERPEGGFRREE